jgi:hypothetical protein
MNQQYFIRVWYGNFIQEIIMHFKYLLLQESEQEKEERLASIPKLCRNCEEENKGGPAQKNPYLNLKSVCLAFLVIFKENISYDTHSLTHDRSLLENWTLNIYPIHFVPLFIFGSYLLGYLTVESPWPR